MDVCLVSVLTYFIDLMSASSLIILSLKSWIAAGLLVLLIQYQPVEAHNRLLRPADTQYVPRQATRATVLENIQRRSETNVLQPRSSACMCPAGLQGGTCMTVSYTVAFLSLLTLGYAEKGDQGPPGPTGAAGGQ